ncbi:rhodanese-like domain-containing protein [Inhella crocodyli]|uniref:Rhodanese-like domain-containing protein n=1 Tax=Inhella crocodyli TaxID=2499851 RepID=A0A3S2UKV8_9BURK|nr:rhodanese-like domain-containing protein [Inhella crocodyli]RVT88533.1 rhodanese-like domain-containing protein [Inhella crocodyli]
MDFLTQNWFLVVMAVGSGLMLLWPSLSGKTAGVSSAEAVRLINREKAVLLDVSEPAEFAAGHAAGSRNLPFGQIEAGAKALPTNKTLPLVVVCPTGARAGRAVSALQKLGYEKAVVLSGGLAAWREANLPTEKSAA